MLTDGVPNVEPSRGHEYELKNYYEKYPDFNCMINSYGFGYNLKSDLLQNISTISKGDGFAFIPDSSLLGNIFIQGISNFMCTYETNCSIKLNLNEDYSFIDDSKTKTLTVDSLKHGKSKNLMFEIKESSNHTSSIKSNEISYPIGSYELIMSNEVINGDILINYTDNSKNQFYRLKAYECLDKCNQLMKFNDKENTKSYIDDFINSLSYENNLYLENIKYDMNGQVKEALNMTRKGEAEDWYSKWGYHYLKSLSDAYKNEICNNFKDKGVSNFTGELFSKLTDEISEVFDNIPPPKKDITNNYYSTNNYQPVDMSVFRNHSGGCVTGNAKIKMFDNTWKSIKDLKKGDNVITITFKNNIQYEDTSEVECLIKTNVDKADLVKLNQSHDFHITPYHPIIEKNTFNQKWQFPINMYKNNPQKIKYNINQKCNGLYTIIMKNRGSIILEDNYIYATLGHNLKDEIVKHDYFGTDTVINDLKLDLNYNIGLVFLSTKMFIRNKTGQVCNIDVYKSKNRIFDLYYAKI